MSILLNLSHDLHMGTLNDVIIKLYLLSQMGQETNPHFHKACSLTVEVPSEM